MVIHPELIPKHLSQILCAVQQAPESHFSVPVTLENQPVVEARHEHVPSGVLRISITPNRANLWVLRQQLDGSANRIDKPLGNGRVRFAEIESLAFDVPLELRALGERGRRCLRA